eukprot:2694842-Pyramimonas_sp.AAC.1
MPPKGGRLRSPSEGVANDQRMRAVIEELAHRVPFVQPGGQAASGEGRAAQPLRAPALALVTR